MGYNLTIGEADFKFYNEEGLESSCDMTAKGFRHDNAPAFGEPTDFTSERWPSYSSWSNFCDEAGLKDVFYYEGGGHLRGGHPGCIPVEIEMQKRVNKALADWRVSHPDAKENFDDTGDSGYLCLLVWLDYWVNWVMDNCEKPVFANS